MKIIFVPDIHGDIKFIERINSDYSTWDKIFVGDLVDSLVFTRTEQLKCVESVLSMIEKGDTQCIFGNHELSYLVGEHMRASGYAGTLDTLLMPLKSKIRKLFKNYIYFYQEKILITHAGLTKYIYNNFDFGLGDINRILEEWSQSPIDQTPLGWIGKIRGGTNTVGGPFWCDWNNEFEPIDGLTQVFGHTAYLDYHKDLKCGIRIQETFTGVLEKKINTGVNYNIDCLQHNKVEILELTNGVFTIKNYDIN